MMLRRCINDSKTVFTYLKDILHIPETNIMLLNDEQATRKTILNTFESHFIDNLAITPGDAMIFYFAGHGSHQKAPLDWNSEDNKVETICPYNVVNTSGILDYTFTYLFVLLFVVPPLLHVSPALLLLIVLPFLLLLVMLPLTLPSSSLLQLLLHCCHCCCCCVIVTVAAAALSSLLLLLHCRHCCCCCIIIAVAAAVSLLLSLLLPYIRCCCCCPCHYLLASLLLHRILVAIVKPIPVVERFSLVSNLCACHQTLLAVSKLVLRASSQCQGVVKSWWGHR